MEAPHREALEERIAAFSELGVDFWYLASWRDPFGNPWRYASEIASYWGLTDSSLLVVFLRSGGRWHVVGWRGEAVRTRIPDGDWLGALKEAEGRLRSLHPSRVAISLADGLLSLLREGGVAGSVGEKRRVPPGVLVGIALFGIYLFVRVLRAVRTRRGWV